MLYQKKQPHSWIIGLSSSEVQLLNTYFDGEQTFSLWELDNLPDTTAMQREMPYLIWVSPEGSKAIARLAAIDRQHFDLLPKVLLLDKAYTLKDFEDASDSNAAAIIKPPFSREKFMAVSAQALEAQEVHHDIFCMAQSLLLERELLARKNELLSFLTRFLTSTSATLDIQEIMQNAFSALSILYPLRSLHLGLFQPDLHYKKDVSLFIASPQRSKAFKLWEQELLEKLRHLSPLAPAVKNRSVLQLDPTQNRVKSHNPTEGIVLSLPITSGQEKIGILLLQLESEKNIGRDQALALDSAIRHLGITLTNALQVAILQRHANIDGLTHIHNRRHFERKLAEELDRANRYNQPFSLIMIDIDHFKHVNDTFGHQTGDIVLQELSSFIATTIRASDYCARFGGEEFVLLLPNTDAEKAYILSERLRKKIAAHEFKACEKSFHVSISLGITHVCGENQKTREQLICEADAALYQAKKMGRNCSYCNIWHPYQQQMLA